MLKCVSVTLLKKLEGMDVLQVNLSDGTSPLWFYDYAKALEFVDKEVIVNTRSDMYEGNIVTVINTFVMPSVVNTVEKHENIRLFCEQDDNLSNLSFNEIGDGETKNNCLFYCVAQDRKTSDKSTWSEYIIRDKSLRTMKLRIFNDENPNAELAGKYCMAALTKTKFGLQTSTIVPTSGECPRNKEIDIAKEFVQTYFMQDEHAKAFMDGTGYIGKLENVIDYEQGYKLVRLAMELSMCEQLYNVTNNVDIKLIEHALLTSHAYCCTEMSFSPEVRNIILTMRCKWPNVPKLVAMHDPGAVDSRPEEYDIFLSIKSVVDRILENKKSYKA